MQSYALDLTTILHLLQGRSGRLQATLEALPGIKEPCLVSLVLLDGKVSSCFLETHQGMLLAQGERVLTLVAGLGTLDWLWEPQRRTTTLLPGYPGGSIPGKVSSIPQRRDPLRPDLLAACSRIQRRVLGLVDGRRTVQEIALLLAVPSAEIERLQAVLDELQVMGLITLDL
jgi:hypothetical protein